MYPLDSSSSRYWACHESDSSYFSKDAQSTLQVAGGVCRRPATSDQAGEDHLRLLRWLTDLPFFSLFPVSASFLQAIFKPLKPFRILRTLPFLPAHSKAPGGRHRDMRIPESRKTDLSSLKTPIDPCSGRGFTGAYRSYGTHSGTYWAKSRPTGDHQSLPPLYLLSSLPSSLLPLSLPSSLTPRSTLLSPQHPFMPRDA